MTTTSPHKRHRSIRVLLAASLVAASTLVLGGQQAAAAGPNVPPMVVMTRGDDLLNVVDESGAVTASVSVGTDPSAVAITPDGKKAVVVNEASDNVSIVTLTGPSGPAVSATLAVGDRPVAVAIAPDGVRAYVLSGGTGTVTPIVLANNTAEPPIVVGPDPRALAIHPTGQKLYVTLGGFDVVFVNLVDRRPSAPIRVGPDPRGIAITPYGEVVYVVTRGNNKVVLLYDDKVADDVDVAAGPDAIAMSPNRDRALVTSTTGVVTEISMVANGALTDNPVRTIPVGTTPSSVAFDASGRRAWVTSASGNSIVPVNVSAGGAVSGFASPGAIANVPDQAPKAALSVSSPADAVSCPVGVTGALCVGEGGTVTFNASATTSSSTPVASYAWDFGDGTQVTNTSSSITHTYTDAGTYSPSVTATTTAGTNTVLLFTGQTANRNGSSLAVARASVRVLSSEDVNAISPFVYVSMAGGQMVPLLAEPGEAPKRLQPFAAGRLPVFSAVAPTGAAIVSPDAANGTAVATAVCDTPDGVTFKPGNQVLVGTKPHRTAIAPTARSSSADEDVFDVLVTDLETPALRRLTLTVDKENCEASLAEASVSAISLGSPATAVAISPDGGTAYATVPRLGVVVPINLDRSLPMAPIPVGPEPNAVVVTPRAGDYTVFVANSGSNTLTPIQGNRPLPTITVGRNPLDLAITPDGTLLLSANGEQTVTPVSIPTTGPAVPEAPISLAAIPTGIAISPDGQRAWVSSYWSHTLTPISIADRTAGSPMGGFTNAIGVAAAPNQGPNATLAATTPTDSTCEFPTPGDVDVMLCPKVGTTVTFDAGDSEAGSTDIVEYEWDFGDGTPLLTTNDPVVSHTYVRPGRVVVSLVVTDASGTSLTRTFTGQTVGRRGSSAARAYGLFFFTTDPVPTGVPVLYVSTASADAVTPVVLDGGTPWVSNPVPAGRFPVMPAVTPDGRAIVAPNLITGEVLAIAVCPEDGELTYKTGNKMTSGLDPISVALSSPVTLSPTASTYTVLVANNGGSEVRRFRLDVDTSAASCGATLSISPTETAIAVGPKPYEIVVASPTKAYVSVSGLGVVPIDLTTGMAQQAIQPLQPRPGMDDFRGMALHGTTLLVTNRGTNSVMVIDTLADAVVATYTVGSRPTSVAISPDGEQAFVATEGALGFTPIDLTTVATQYVVGDEVALGVLPTDVVFDPSGDTAYFSSYSSNVAVVLDVSTLTVQTTLHGLYGAIGLATAPPVG